MSAPARSTGTSRRARTSSTRSCRAGWTGSTRPPTKALAHEGPPRELLLDWFAAYVALISLHKGGPAKITSALGDPASPIVHKCQVLTAASDRVVARLRDEHALRADVDSVHICRLVGGVAAVADQGGLDESAVRPLLEVVADGLLAP